MAHGSFGHLLAVVEQRVTATSPQTTTAQPASVALAGVAGISTSGLTTTAQVATASLVGVAGTSTGGAVTKTAQVATLTLTGVAGTSSGLILSDDFSGSSINTAIWDVFNRPMDQYNGEVGAVIPANVRVGSGTLKIDQKFEDVVSADSLQGSPDASTPATYHYTSGQIGQHAPSFLYGDVQVRAKIPGGTGNWPCIWMLGYLWQPSQPYTANIIGHNWPHGGWWECDIAEFMGGHRDVVNNALHFESANRGGSGEKSLPFNATTRFMVYRLVWAPGSMTWYVDAEDGNGWVQTLQITGTAGTDIPNTPGYLIIHTAIGGTAGGTPDSSTYPTVMEVDWAKITATSDTVSSLISTAQIATVTLTGVQGGSSTGAVTKTAQVGAIALVGVAGSSSATRTSTAQVATVALTGVQGTSTGGAVTQTAQAGTVTLTGVAGSSSNGGSPQTATAQVATVALAGVAGVSAGGPVSQIAQVATLTLGGVAGTSTIGLRTVAQVGAVALVGVAGTSTGAAVTQAAQVADLTLAGIAGTLSAGAVTKTAQVCTLTLTAVPGVPSIGGGTVVAQPCTLTLTPRPGTVTAGAATKAAQVCTLTLECVPGVVYGDENFLTVVVGRLRTRRADPVRGTRRADLPRTTRSAE